MKKAPSLDEVDQKIISQLQTNGRTALEELAKTIGFTSMGNKKRLQKLVDQNSIKDIVSIIGEIQR